MKNKIKWIKVLAMDVDGVLTDGTVILGNGKNDEYKIFNEQDAAGLRMLLRAGIIPAIITGRTSKLVSNWAANIGIKDVHQKAFVKIEALKIIIDKYKLLPDEIAYIGDDLIDIGVLKNVGFAVAVKNAVNEVKQEADYITSKTGGQGAVREIVELILKTQKKWELVTNKYYT
ncbi:HAD hydrolase family protein [Candidatus Poribacteria bacterium]|nr:HAD hydrolase family protein [Candidatus Poribacteria bacterium]